MITSLLTSVVGYVAGVPVMYIVAGGLVLLAFKLLLGISSYLRRAQVGCFVEQNNHVYYKHMRIIIIIQAIIIILGAYYLFLQSQEKPAMTSEVIDKPLITPTVREGYTPPIENPPADSETAVSTSSTGVTGHSDVGMEYPIIDGTMEVR